MTGRNEMDPPLCGSTAMSHNEFKKIREPIEPQEVSPMKQEMTVLGIDLAKHVFHAVGMENTGKIVFRKRLSRHDLRPCIAKLPMVLLGLSLWRRALLGETLPCVWPRSEAHGTAIRQAVRQVEYKRQPRCRGHRGSGDASDHALCAGQGRRSARHSSAPSRARAAHKRADSPGECSARADARVWHCDAQRGVEVSSSR